MNTCITLPNSHHLVYRRHMTVVLMHSWKLYHRTVPAFTHTRQPWEHHRTVMTSTRSWALSNNKLRSWNKKPGNFWRRMKGKDTAYSLLATVDMLLWLRLNNKMAEEMRQLSDRKSTNLTPGTAGTAHSTAAGCSLLTTCSWGGAEIFTWSFVWVRFCYTSRETSPTGGRGRGGIFASRECHIIMYQVLLLRHWCSYASMTMCYINGRSVVFC